MSLINANWCRYLLIFWLDIFLIAINEWILLFCIIFFLRHMQFFYNFHIDYSVIQRLTWTLLLRKSIKILIALTTRIPYLSPFCLKCARRWIFWLIEASIKLLQLTYFYLINCFLIRRTFVILFCSLRLCIFLLWISIFSLLEQNKTGIFSLIWLLFSLDIRFTSERFILFFVAA